MESENSQKMGESSRGSRFMFFSTGSRTRKFFMPPDSSQELEIYNAGKLKKLNTIQEELNNKNGLE